MVYSECTSLGTFSAAKMEVSVVGIDPSALSMTSRNVIISYRDMNKNTTYYLQLNPTDNTSVMATEVWLYFITRWMFYHTISLNRSCKMLQFFKWQQIHV